MPVLSFSWLKNTSWPASAFRPGARLSWPRGSRRHATINGWKVPDCTSWTRWGGWSAAREHLRQLIDDRIVRCEWEGWSYKRRVGVCHVLRDDYVEGWTTWHNLNNQMVADGFALDCAPYSNGLSWTLEPSGARWSAIQKPYC